jgi:hypothetical protein
LKIFPWTINTRDEAEKVLALGVDGLICNELRVMPEVPKALRFETTTPTRTFHEPGCAA